MIDWSIDITDLEDLRSEQNEHMQSEFLQLGETHLAAGNRIVIKRSYVNAPDDQVTKFTDASNFREYWKSFFS